MGILFYRHHLIVFSGNFIFPLHVGLWLPKSHAKYRSKNDMLIDFIANLESLVADRNQTLSDVEITFDSGCTKSNENSWAN